MSDVAQEASGVRASSPEAAAERREDGESGGKKSAAVQKDGLTVRVGQHELASLPVGEAAVTIKRAKKSVERLDLQAPKHKEKLKIAQGSGDKLGDIPRTNFQIGKLKSEDLKPLHAILFERPGKMASVKKNLRLFNGFPFSADSDQYLRKRDKLLKNTHLTNAKLKLVCSVLDLEKKGTQSELVDRIMTFLLEPKNSGKRLPVKKKKRSRKKASTESAAKSKKTKSDTKSRRVSSSSSSPKKSKAPSKSKAIVMDSSSDDEEEDKAPDGEASDTEDKSSHKDDEEEEEEEEDEEDKPASKKRSRTPAKKTPPPRKRVKRDLSDDDSDSDEAKNKKKPAAKTKKADSSSKNTNTDDTSDEDEPLIKMIHRAPSDDELKETVCTLLKDADLAQMTMKQICQRVFDTYPDHDLSSRKDFIKQSVKSLIT